MFGNPQSNYVIAAYAVAAVLLLGLVIISWRGFRVRHVELAAREKENS